MVIMRYEGSNVDTELCIIRKVGELKPEVNFYGIDWDGGGAVLKKSKFKTAPKVGDELLLYTVDLQIIGFDLNGVRQWRKRGFHKGNPPKRTK